MNDILSSQQVADMLDCTQETVEDKARRGQIPGLKFGRSWVFPRVALLDTLNALARKNTEVAAPAPEPRSRRRPVPAIPPFPFPTDEAA